MPMHPGTADSWPGLFVVIRQTCLDLVPEASVGDYVLVHVGFAISLVDQEEAARSYQLLESMGLLQEELGPAGEDS